MKPWHLPRFPLASFPALASDYNFPRLPRATCFHALATGYTFSRAFHQLHPSRACHGLHVLPRLPRATCFPALATGFMFFRSFYRIRVSRVATGYMSPVLSNFFPRITSLKRFSALATGYTFSRAWYKVVGYRVTVFSPRLIIPFGAVVLRQS